MNLSRVLRVVANIHVDLLPEPRHEVCNHLRIRTWIEERVNIDLTNIRGSHIAVGLRHECVSRAGVVESLGAQSCCGDDLDFLSVQSDGDECNRYEGKKRCSHLGSRRRGTSLGPSKSLEILGTREDCSAGTAVA